MACAWLPIACAQHSLGIGFLRAGFGHVLRGRCSVRDVLGIGFQSARSSHTSKAARVRPGRWGRGRTGVAGDGRTAGGWVAHTRGVLRRAEVRISGHEGAICRYDGSYLVP